MLFYCLSTGSMIFPTILHTRAAVTEVNGGYEAEVCKLRLPY